MFAVENLGLLLIFQCRPFELQSAEAASSATGAARMLLAKDAGGASGSTGLMVISESEKVSADINNFGLLLTVVLLWCTFRAVLSRCDRRRRLPAALLEEPVRCSPTTPAPL